MATCHLMQCQKIITFSFFLNKYRLHNFTDICITLCRPQTNNNKFTTVDLLDDFTKNLVKQKTDKWNDIGKMKTSVPPKDPYMLQTAWNFNYKSDLRNLSHNKLEIDITTLSRQQIDSLIISALKSNRLDDVEYLIVQFIGNKQCPSLAVLLYILTVYSQNGDVKMIKSLQRFYKLINPEVCLENSDFNNYLARSHWMKGNVQKGLELFLDVYKNNRNLQSEIRIMLKRLIYDTVLNRSEASVVILNKYVLLFGSDCGEWYPLSCFWENCWQSEWFCDQQLADNLFKEKIQLRNLLKDNLVPMSVVALRNHQEDAVIRLLQLTLLFDMKFQYTKIIQALFNHRCRQNDVAGCSAIVQSCSVLKINLTALQYEKYLNMLIDKDDRSIPSTTKAQKNPLPVNQYRLKF